MVTIMGHVDHGKTTLLDAIRNTNIAAHEVGGITQHIGAYKIKTNNGEISFIDTPGHEAFTAMRARGAMITDIVVLIIAADDGVMPQTIEAINHAKVANVPIIVCINKIDLPDANSDRIRQSVANYGLIDERWGGDTIFCEVSARQKKGIDNLLEMILLQAEMLDLSCSLGTKARGVVIEARIDKGLGPVGTVIVQDGILKIRNTFIVGNQVGRVRAMIDDMRRRLNEAYPSTPVEILGFSETPEVGEKFLVVDKDAINKYLKEKSLHVVSFETPKISLETLRKRIEEGEIKELPIIIKGDTTGSCEALADALKKIEISDVKINILHYYAGSILEQDIMLAKASGGIIIGFHIKPDAKIKQIAEREGVKIYIYDVIYAAIEEIEKAAKGMLEPILKEEVIGRVVVRKIFRIEKKQIAGCFVEGGRVEIGAKARVIRDGKNVLEAGISSLKRFKEDVSIVRAGFECGIGLASNEEIKIGDILEVFLLVKEQRT